MSLDPLAALVEGKRLLSAQASGLPERRVAVLGSFTLNYLSPLVAVALKDQGFQPRVHQGGFNSWAQELLDEGSALYAFKPEAVLIVTDLQDLFPMWYGDPRQSDKVQLDLIEDCLSTFKGCLSKLRKLAPQTTPYLVIPSLDRLPGEAVASPADPFRGQRRLEEFLQRLRALEGTVIVDWDLHARREGMARYRDERLWYMGRMRLNPAGCQALAQLFAYNHGLLHTPRAKVVVTDLDDTLWGGVIGEEGWQGLELGREGLGLAFREFQEELSRLRQAGLLLAVCSRNDEAAAWEAFDKHPDMALKRSDFSAWRINWEDKAANLEAIARELNVGLESLVFLDDDPVQRGAAASRLPVLVPELPKDPAARPAFLRGLAALHRPTLTAEDLQRSELYAQRAERETLRSRASSLEDYLRSLAQEATVNPVDAGTLPRAAQLCLKTNQFNLTTKRHTEADLKALLRDKRFEAYTLALKDNFGDNGIVGLGILRVEGAEAEIDTFLMSCRVLGRKAELALLSHLASRARRRKAKHLLGRYLPTPKNAPAKDFYPRAGFSATADPTLFRLDLAKQGVEAPREIKLVSREAHAAAA